MSLLTHLASADPYALLKHDSASSLEGSPPSLQTAASDNLLSKAKDDLEHATPQSTPVSALTMLQQLIEEPSSNVADTASSRHILMACPAVQSQHSDDATDWDIISNFCSRTVSKKWLCLVLQQWQDFAKAQVKWRCIQQVSSFAIHDMAWSISPCNHSAACLTQHCTEDTTKNWIRSYDVGT